MRSRNEIAWWSLVEKDKVVDGWLANDELMMGRWCDGGGLVEEMWEGDIGGEVVGGLMFEDKKTVMVSGGASFGKVEP
ncbi:unnamed protein product [Linum tenue]|uniref:Uncharacterized protein n=1 Tax=Linum tenue TaxID=586396 RepID=A0AAV0N068_9ROSI|nr:unnamed protein product [Linum tenue]